MLLSTRFWLVKVLLTPTIEKMIFSSAISVFLNYLRSCTGITQVALQANLFRLVRNAICPGPNLFGNKDNANRAERQIYLFSAEMRPFRKGTRANSQCDRPLLVEKLQRNASGITGAFARIEVYGKGDQIPAGVSHFEKRRPLSRCAENQFLHVFRQFRMR